MKEGGEIARITAEKEEFILLIVYRRDDVCVFNHISGVSRLSLKRGMNSYTILGVTEGDDDAKIRKA